MKFIKYFWAIFCSGFFFYLWYSNNLVSFDVKMIDLYIGMFSFIQLDGLKIAVEIISFILLIMSIFYNLFDLIKKDKEKNGLI